MTTAAHFFALAILVGLVQGGTQALSRSLFASMIPRQKSSEFFAFFSVFERYAGILGPGDVRHRRVGDRLGRASPSSRSSSSSSSAALLLTRVDVEAGRREARAAEAELATSH